MRSEQGKHVTRETLITALLALVGVVLAFILFGAGVFWKGLARPKW